MNPLLNSLAFLGATPMERWSYARNFSSRLVNSTWFWTILIVTFSLVVMMYLVGRYLSQRVTILASRSDFDLKSNQAGLGQEERKLLSHIALLAGPKHPEVIFTAGEVFDQGVTRLLQSPQIAGMSQAMRDRTCELLGLLRDRLGFRKTEDVEDAVPSSTRQIAIGQIVSIIKHAGSGTLEGIVVHKKQAAMTLEMQAPVQASPGRIWLVRYSDGRSTWEFEAPVIGTSGREVMLGHAERLRFVNRRRFPRVPTLKPARIAAFPFFAPGSATQAAEFTAGTLTEIAGPGLLVRAAMEGRLGQRVLVVTEIEPGKVIEGLGKVRRVEALGDTNLLAVELLGLTAEEIAELSRQTTLAARATQMPAEQEEENRDEGTRKKE